MMQVKEALTLLFWLVTGISGIYVFVKRVRHDIRSPHIQRRQAEANEQVKVNRELTDHQTRLTALEQQQKENEETNRLILRSLYALVNHSIDGNGIDGLKEVRNNMTDFLTK